MNVVNFEKAVEFVKSRGNKVELARLWYILANEHPSPQVVTQLFAAQRSDGGWAPFWAHDYSSLDATCYRLAQAEQLGITASEPAIRRATDFLAQRQSAAGSWEEDRQVAHITPPCAKPGDLSAKLYLTANCGLWLALRAFFPEQTVKAADYLQVYLDQAGHLPSFWHTHWLAGGLWYKLNRLDLAQRVCEYLSRRITDLAVSNLSWLITTLCAAGAPTDQPAVNKAALLLEQSQHADGRWPSEDGAGQDGHSTLEAMRALWLCGRGLC